MNFSRFLAALTALLLLFSLCACSGTAPIGTVITKQTANTTFTTVPTTTGTTTAAVDESPDESTTTTKNTTTTLPSLGNDNGNSQTGDAIANLAISLVGTPFKNGGNGPAEFDNPGFVAYCYKQNGFTAPRKATSLLNYGVDITPEAIQPGDILVFCNELGEDAGFVGIYIGNHQFVASTNPNSGTKVHKLNNSYWGPRLLAARRFPTT